MKLPHQMSAQETSVPQHQLMKSWGYPVILIVSDIITYTLKKFFTSKYIRKISLQGQFTQTSADKKLGYQAILLLPTVITLHSEKSFTNNHWHRLAYKINLLD